MLPRLPFEPEVGQLVGPSSTMARVREAIVLLSGHPGPFLVRGEPGTGKSLVASILGSAPATVVECRRASLRRVRSMLHPVPDGARCVLLLEEAGDASRELQSLIIEFMRARAPAVLLIATTSRDVERFARTGRILPDFARMLGGPAIWLPPLRTRRSDVPALAMHFMESFPGRELDQDALSLLERQVWPGNVRQLRNAIRRLALLHDRITVGRVEHELKEMRSEQTGA